MSADEILLITRLLPLIIYEVKTLKILAVNETAIEQYGYSREEFLNMTIRDIRPVSQLGALDEALKRPKGKAEYVYPQSYIHSKKSGEQIYVEISSQDVSYNNKACRMVACYDVTERERVMESLHKNELQLEEANKRLQQFAYVASHDLQEPLRMITAFLKLLENKYADSIDDKGKSYIHYAVDGANRMSLLINDLLKYSLIEEDTHAQKTDLNEIIAEVKQLLKLSLSENSVNLNVDLLPTLITSPTGIKQVFLNLINNAIKFRKVKADLIIDIKAKEHESEWLFTVSDNGLGISMVNKDKIFELFTRLNKRDQYPGTGIGLAICKKVIEHLGGKIWVESEEGRGSAFHFTLLK